MEPALIILFAWALFAGSHLYMSGSNLRVRLSPRVSKNQFTVLFVVVTVLTMLVLIAAVATYAGQGRAGPNIGQTGFARWILGALSLCGVTLTVAGLLNYPKSPMAVLAARNLQGPSADQPLRAPTVVEQVSRHPFFMGIAIFMSAHTLMADTLANAVHFGGYVVFAVVGIYLQDKKLRQRWRGVYENFEQSTSAVPFSAKIAKPTAKDWIVWIVAVGVAVFLVGALHHFWRYANGATFLMFDLVFGSLGVIAALAMRKSTPKKNS